MTVHHVDVQDIGSAAFDRANFLAEAGEVRRQDRRSDFDISIEHAPHPPRLALRYGFLVGLETGVGRGASGRRLSLLLVREFVFAGRFAFPFGGRFAFVFGGLLAFAFAFAARFALVFVLPFAFSFVFLGLLGRFAIAIAFAFADELVLRFSLGSSGVGTVSGDSPSFAGRLTSIATV